MGLGSMPPCTSMAATEALGFHSSFFFFFFVADDEAEAEVENAAADAARLVGVTLAAPLPDLRPALPLVWAIPALVARNCSCSLPAVSAMPLMPLPVPVASSVTSTRSSRACASA